jgi:hypothetical protein
MTARGDVMDDGQERTQESPEPEPKQEKARRGFSGLQVLGIVVVAILGTAAITFFVVKAYIFPSQFDPVRLSAREDQVLQAKLQRLDPVWAAGGPGGEPATGQGGLEPEAYRENDADRLIGFTEKELNALIARNTDLADKLAIDLSANLASAKLLIPVPEDFPVMGGRNLRVAAGLELSFTGGRPRAVLKGVSVMGVPVPSAWLGNLRDVNLLERVGGNKGFWSTLAAGVESLEIRDGELKLALKE